MPLQTQKGALLWPLNGALASIKESFNTNDIASANLSAALIMHRWL